MCLVNNTTLLHAQNSLQGPLFTATRLFPTAKVTDTWPPETTPARKLTEGLWAEAGRSGRPGRRREEGLAPGSPCPRPSLACRAQSLLYLCSGGQTLPSFVTWVFRGHLLHKTWSRPTFLKSKNRWVKILCYANGILSRASSTQTSRDPKGKRKDGERVRAWPPRRPALTCVLPAVLGQGVPRATRKATEVTQERLLACCNNKQMRDCGGHRSLKHIYQGFQGY